MGGGVQTRVTDVSVTSRAVSWETPAMTGGRERERETNRVCEPKKPQSPPFGLFT